MPESEVILILWNYFQKIILSMVLKYLKFWHSIVLCWGSFFKRIFYGEGGKKNIKWSKMISVAHVKKRRISGKPWKIIEFSRSFERKDIILNQKLFEVCCWIEKVAHLQIFLRFQNSFGVLAPAKTFMKILKRSDHGLTVCVRSDLSGALG